MDNLIFSKKLTALRTSKGVTQEEVAKSLSVSNKTVSKWETGQSVPDIFTLAAIAKYYNTTADALLGPAEEQEQNTADTVRTAFSGLTAPAAVLKAFEAIQAIVPAVYQTMAGASDTAAPEDCYPSDNAPDCSNKISTDIYFQYTAASVKNNVAVTLLQNKDNFSWLKDPEILKKMATLFGKLSEEGAVSLLAFLRSGACPEVFTADYAAKQTNLSVNTVSELLKYFTDIGECSSCIAHLAEGDSVVYESSDEGLLLAILSLVYEKLCGASLYNCNLSRSCKMIKGEIK